MVGTWLGEIGSCSCLAVLPDSAWILLNKIYQPSLYVPVLVKFDSSLQREEDECKGSMTLK